MKACVLPRRVAPTGSPSRSPSGHGHPRKGIPARPPSSRPCGKPDEPGSAPGCSPRSSPVHHLTPEQMDDTEATFFSPSSGKMNLTKCCRHHPTGFHIHRGQGPLTEHRPIPQPRAGAQGRDWRQDEHFASFASSVRLFLSPGDPSAALGALAVPPGGELDDTWKQMFQDRGKMRLCSGER